MCVCVCVPLGGNIREATVNVVLRIMILPYVQQVYYHYIHTHTHVWELQPRAPSCWLHHTHTFWLHSPWCHVRTTNGLDLCDWSRVSRPKAMR